MLGVGVRVAERRREELQQGRQRRIVPRRLLQRPAARCTGRHLGQRRKSLFQNLVDPQPEAHVGAALRLRHRPCPGHPLRIELGAWSLVGGGHVCLALEHCPGRREQQDVGPKTAATKGEVRRAHITVSKHCVAAICE